RKDSGRFDCQAARDRYFAAYRFRVKRRKSVRNPARNRKGPGSPDLRIIVTGSGVDEETILKAIASGAKGYVDEAASPAEFVQAIRVVNQGSVWAPRHVLSVFIERVSTSPGRIFPAGRVTFTDREKEVLEMLVAGRSNKEIGAALGIEERTVKAHVAKLMRKVGVQNRIALSVHAITHSLVTAK